MSWQTITLVVPEGLKDAVVGEFSSDGIRGVWEHDLPGGGDTELVLYFDSHRVPPLVRARIGRVFERNGYPPPRVVAGIQEKEDWSREWRKGFTAFPLGRKFRVVPSWEEPPEEDDRIPIRIDPGMAFGTGTHETTQLALEELEALDPAAGVVLDIGAGSAILSIAAVHLGHKRVIACDIDADAIQVARGNLGRNRSDAVPFVGSAAAVRPGSVGLALANLTADVIRDLLPEIRRVIQPGGIAVFSGILDVQAEAVRGRIVEAGFTVLRERGRGEWVALVSRYGG